MPNDVIFTKFDVKVYKEEFGDIKGVIRIRKSKNDRQHNGRKKKDKQLSTTQYTEN